MLIRPLKSVGLPHLSRPLAKDVVTNTKNGEVHHSDIIGQPKRVFLSYRGKKVHKNQKDLRFIVTEPNLDEYTSMIKRKAQPIYSMDAEMIVSLADIDPDTEVDTDFDTEVDQDPKFENWQAESENEPQQCGVFNRKLYLEAGTGNGSLTLSICKAIHGSNALARHFDDQNRRGAILYSLDRREDHLKMGEWNVKNYKRGKFSRDVEFLVRELPVEFLDENLNLKFSGVFLDLPDPHLYFSRIADQMTLDGTLIVFCPSVTQILKCREVLAESHLQNQKIDLSLVKTVELPPGNGGGTREWDVNTVFTRETGEKVSVCRPKVGAKVVGGGFVGVFKKPCVIGQSLQSELSKLEIELENELG